MFFAFFIKLNFSNPTLSLLLISPRHVQFHIFCSCANAISCCSSNTLINYIVSASTVRVNSCRKALSPLRVQAVKSPILLIQFCRAQTFPPQQNPIKCAITSWPILQICLQSSSIMKCEVKPWVIDYSWQTHTHSLICGSVVLALVTVRDTCRLRKCTATHTFVFTHTHTILVIS